MRQVDRLRKRAFVLGHWAPRDDLIVRQVLQPSGPHPALERRRVEKEDAALGPVYRWPLKLLRELPVEADNIRHLVDSLWIGVVGPILEIHLHLLCLADRDAVDPIHRQGNRRRKQLIDRRLAIDAKRDLVIHNLKRRAKMLRRRSSWLLNARPVLVNKKSLY